MRNIIYPFILSKFKVSRVVRNSEKYAKFTHKNIYRNTYLSPIPFPTCTAIVNLHQIRAFSSKRSKYFQETENEYAHQIMETLSDYSHSLLKYPLEIDKCQINSMECREEIFDKFSKVTADNLSDGLSLEEKKFSGLVEEMCSSLPCASDEDVQRTLHNLCLWPPTPKTTTPNFKALWNTLDQECVKRLKNWDVFFKKISNMSQESNYHLVFVYGTLKKGEPNHNLIKNAKGRAVFIGKARTIKQWPLVIASRYNIPYLLYHEGKGKNVVGEIYEVDATMLSSFDELENHPEYYTRLKEEVQMILEDGFVGKMVRPWIYFLKNFRPVLLDLPSISDYSSKGSHGLEYVNS